MSPVFTIYKYINLYINNDINISEYLYYEIFIL